MYREVNRKPKKSNRKNAQYRRIGIIIALIAVVIFVIAAVRSCGADTETPNTEVSENGAYTENENNAGSTEGEITDPTETETTEPLTTEEPATETPATEADTEESVNHDIPDLSGLEYPFTTMSLDWGEDTLEGWYHYDIPDEYVQTGGYFPDAVQVYTYALCTQNDIDYPMVLALVEVESGYKYDAVSRNGAVGYMQVVPSLHPERLGNPLSDEAFINPYLNIDAGIDYLVELFGRFSSEEEVLTAYHYGVTGAYRDYWNKGEAGSPYSDEVLEIAERIRTEIYGG
ncbi:MAG: lytic transglycosylase domain-containing protein [Lachnospiraceae bacterium]|nr:lytic transglycosylase domain-containing protein [Lachnospiraceae bacterium]